LDLLTIETLAGFFSRPTIWFSILGIPFALMGVLIAAGTVFRFFATGTFPMSLAGTGLLFVTLSVFLFFNGVLGELVYHTGETRTEEFATMTISEHLDSQDSRLAEEHKTQ
jgi:hypothetical protein